MPSFLFGPTHRSRYAAKAIGGGVLVKFGAKAEAAGDWWAAGLRFAAAAISDEYDCPVSGIYEAAAAGENSDKLMTMLARSGAPLALPCDWDSVLSFNR